MNDSNYSMRMRSIAAILVLAIAMLAAPAARAQTFDSTPASDRTAAPDFAADVWLNSKPLTRASLRGKVVLVDFWEYTCINCIRTFPYLRRWNQLYSPLGLVIIGVHTPEFDFGKNPELVKHAVKRFGFTFPIVVDSDRKVWDAFHNDAWPADYLIDRNGNLVFSHLGEGEYADMEHRIQALLKETNPKLDFAAAKFKILGDEPSLGGVCQRATPELYLGVARAEHIANAGGFTPMKEVRYQPPGDVPLDTFGLSGQWTAMPQFIAHGDGAAGSVEVRYRASSVYLVAGSEAVHGQPLYVTQDRLPLAPNLRGVDVKADASGRTYIQLGRKRMYYVVNNPAFGEHTLTMNAQAPAIELYSLTFGNNCENKFDHK